MEYDIIDSIIELAVSCIKLDDKLAIASRLFLESFPFDQCGIYLWDGKKGFFRLRAAHGPGPKLESYGEDEGLPGLIRKKGAIETCQGDALWEASDEGLKGFKRAYVAPLKDKTALYGALYLKSGKGHAKAAFDPHLLNLAAMQLVSVIKCSELVSNQQRAYKELKDMQGRLSSLEKLMTLGDMAAALAHEIKNPLISIGGFASRLKRHLEPGSPGHPYVDQMLHEIERIEKLVNGIVGFVKDSATEPRLDDVNDILEEALRVFEEEFSSHDISVIKDFHKGRLPVLVDREQLKIAFDNLIANAIQSMEHGGTLILSTSLSEGSVIAQVADNGGGIDPRHVGYIFDPFFTTKKYGTGLGLPITSSIMMRHKGAVEVSNNAGVGVTFILKLPHAEDKKRLI